MAKPQPLQTEFPGKTWIFVAQAVLIGSLAAFSMVMGPLFLLGIVKSADGRPTTDAGIALTLMSLPLAAVVALAVFNIAARIRPVLRLCREGVEVNLVGSTSMSGVPGMIRVAWLVLSPQGFKRQFVRVAWNGFENAYVSGLPTSRTLTIVGTFVAIGPEENEPLLVASQIFFPEHTFQTSLDQIAATIQTFQRDLALRDSLPKRNG